MKRNYAGKEMDSSISKICHSIFDVFPHVKTLLFHQSSFGNVVPLKFIDSLPSTFRCSTLLKLNVRVQDFDDCLYLLDGRFSQLHTLDVKVVVLCHFERIANQVCLQTTLSVKKQEQNSFFLLGSFTKSEMFFSIISSESILFE